MRDRQILYYQCDVSLFKIDSIQTQNKFDEVSIFAKSILLDALLAEADQLELKYKYHSDSVTLKEAVDSLDEVSIKLRALKSLLDKDLFLKNKDEASKALDFCSLSTEALSSLLRPSLAPLIDQHIRKELEDTKEGKRAFTAFAFYLHLFKLHFSNGTRGDFGSADLKETVRSYISDGDLEREYSSTVLKSYGRALKPFEHFNIPQLNVQTWESSKNESLKANARLYFDTVWRNCGGNLVKIEYSPDFGSFFERVPAVWACKPETKSSALVRLVQSYIGGLSKDCFK